MSKMLSCCEYDSLAKQDGRTRPARLVRDFKADLMASIGGEPTIGQRVRIVQAANIQLRLAQMDAAAASSEYLELATALNALLDQIGLTGAVETPCSVVQASEGAAA